MTDKVLVTLRSDTDVVARELERQLSERLELAGIEVLEARLNHLAYAPEVASAMPSAARPWSATCSSSSAVRSTRSR